MQNDIIAQELMLWSKGVRGEVSFWTNWVSSGGGKYPEDFARRVSGTAKFDPFLENLFPAGARIDILDVGAGPITFLGTTSNRNRISITATDPLADAYAGILSSHGITAPVATVFATAEDLGAFFPADRFDVVHCRNALDHSFNPVRGIDQMLLVARPGGIVILRHHVNEGETENYSGFHQYNFDEDGGHFMVWRPGIRVDITASVADRAKVETKISPNRKWIEVIMRKHENVGGAGTAGQAPEPDDSRDRLRDIIRGTFAFIIEKFGHD